MTDTVTFWFVLIMWLGIGACFISVLWRMAAERREMEARLQRFIAKRTREKEWTA